MVTRIVVATALLAAAASARGQTYSYDAEAPPNLAYNNLGAWQLNGGAWSTAYARSGTHSLDLFGSVASHWMPQEFSDGVQYIAVDFHALAPAGPAPAATVTFDVGAQPIVAGPAWTANTFVVRSMGYFSATRFRFYGPGAYLDDVSIHAVTRSAAAAIQDANFAALMPTPFSYTAPSNRFALLPNAAARLTAGQSLKVLMVGDSIVNDTYHSYFDSLVDRHYAGAQLNTSLSVVGGAGAIYWAQGTRIADAMAGNPDVLMFGGVSTHVLDVPLIHDIIAKARAVNPAIEIVLTARMAGDRNQPDNNPFLNAALAAPVDPNGTDYRATLYRLAAAENVQFWDVTVPWSQYLLGSGLDAAAFYRDQIHMNGLGNMLAGRVMESFFAPPPTADFSGDGLVNGADLGLWRANAGKAAGALRGEGDADGDHDVDGADLLAWQRQVGAGSAGSAIPEPAGWAPAAGLGALVAAGGRRRR